LRSPLLLGVSKVGLKLIRWNNVHIFGSVFFQNAMLMWLHSVLSDLLQLINEVVIAIDRMAVSEPNNISQT